MAEPEGPLSEADRLRGRFLVHLEELEAQQASFDRLAERLGEDGFVAAWIRDGTEEQVDRKGGLERAQEQIVNELPEMVDDLERLGAAKGLLPDPDPDSDTSGWWTAAEALGIDTVGGARSERPGRWRRLAFYGCIDHELPAR